MTSANSVATLERYIRALLILLLFFLLQEEAHQLPPKQSLSCLLAFSGGIWRHTLIAHTIMHQKESPLLVAEL